MTTDTAPVEKRRHLRIAVRIGYTLRTGLHSFSGFTGNVSAGGCYLETVEPPFSEDLLGRNGEIELALATSAVAFPCQIVYVGGQQEHMPAGVGIMFTDTEDGQWEALKEFIVERL